MTSEIKFLISRATADRIREWARTHLDPDPHGEGPFGDQYRTTTIYFDTGSFDVFHRRGSYGRSKYRVRRYDGADVVFVERKMRRGARLAKRRTALALRDLTCLPAWFEQRLALRGLKPVCQISYDRMARMAQTPSGAMRLTLDGNIRALPTGELAFGRTGAMPLLPNQLVLEVKFDGPPPALFKQLLDDFALSPARVSKYRLTVDALGLIREDAVAQPAICAGAATYA